MNKFIIWLFMGIIYAGVFELVSLINLPYIGSSTFLIALVAGFIVSGAGALITRK